MPPQAWARSYTGMPRAMAPAISGLPSWMAAVRITASQFFRFSAEWPMATSHAQGPQVPDGVAVRHVGALHHKAHALQYLGQRAHGYAADTGQMDALAGL